MASTPPRPAPVFLVAAPRSGAALLRAMLAQHPDIAFAPEFDFLVDAISPDGRFMKRDAFARAMDLNPGFRRLGLSIPADMPFVAIANNLIDQVAATRPGAAVVGVVLQHHFDRALWLWPDARFIHLVRDGRDVAMAAVGARAAGNMWHGIAEWADAEMLWERMSHKLPPERQITLKYETLATDTHHELQRLTDFLGVPYDPAMLEGARGYAPPRGDVAGRWRKADIGETSAAEHRAARWLLQNGYFLSGTVRPPSILRRSALNIQNRLAVANDRRSKLGTGTWLKGVWIDKLGSRKAKQRMTRLRNERLDKD